MSPQRPDTTNQQLPGRPNVDQEAPGGHRPSDQRHDTVGRDEEE